MACDYCTDLKIFYEQFTTWERKTYVCYIDGHSARTPDELEDTCPYLELEWKYFVLTSKINTNIEVFLKEMIL